MELITSSTTPNKKYIAGIAHEGIIFDQNYHVLFIIKLLDIYIAFRNSLAFHIIKHISLTPFFIFFIGFSRGYDNFIVSQAIQDGVPVIDGSSTIGDLHQTISDGNHVGFSKKTC